MCFIIHAIVKQLNLCIQYTSESLFFFFPFGFLCTEKKEINFNFYCYFPLKITFYYVSSVHHLSTDVCIYSYNIFSVHYYYFIIFSAFPFWLLSVVFIILLTRVCQSILKSACRHIFDLKWFSAFIFYFKLS